VTYDSRAIAKQCLSLAGGAFVTFATTAALLTAAGLGLAAVSWLMLSESPWGYRAAAAGLALLEGFGVGVLLGFKRATAGALVRGLGSLQLGRLIVGVVFDKMLRLQPDDATTTAVKPTAIERHEAERRLDEAVREVEREGAGDGLVQQAIGRRLLAAVRSYVLGRFASEKSLIDLGKIRAESERAIDERLSDHIRSGARLTTWLVVAALPLVAALQIRLIGKFAS
jgi:hypothetical protein